MTNAPPRRSVIYYDTNGLERVIVGDRGGVGMLTDRIFYENGSARLEWWYGEAWHPVEERNNEMGIVVDGQWTRMGLSNGVIVPDPSE